MLSSKAAFADKSSDDGMYPVEVYRVSTNKELNLKSPCSENQVFYVVYLSM